MTGDERIDYQDETQGIDTYRDTIINGGVIDIAKLMGDLAPGTEDASSALKLIDSLLYESFSGSFDGYYSKVVANTSASMELGQTSHQQFAEILETATQLHLAIESCLSEPALRLPKYKNKMPILPALEKPKARSDKDIKESLTLGLCGAMIQLLSTFDRDKPCGVNDIIACFVSRLNMTRTGRAKSDALVNIRGAQDVTLVNTHKEAFFDMLKNKTLKQQDNAATKLEPRKIGLLLQSIGYNELRTFNLEDNDAALLKTIPEMCLRWHVARRACKASKSLFNCHPDSLKTLVKDAKDDRNGTRTIGSTNLRTMEGFESVFDGLMCSDDSRDSKQRNDVGATKGHFYYINKMSKLIAKALVNLVILNNSLDANRPALEGILGTAEYNMSIILAIRGQIDRKISNIQANTGRDAGVIARLAQPYDALKTILQDYAAALGNDFTQELDLRATKAPKRFARAKNKFRNTFGIRYKSLQTTPQNAPVLQPAYSEQSVGNVEPEEENAAPPIQADADDTASPHTSSASSNYANAAEVAPKDATSERPPAEAQHTNAGIASGLVSAPANKNDSSSRSISAVSASESRRESAAGSKDATSERPPAEAQHTNADIASGLVSAPANKNDSSSSSISAVSVSESRRESANNNNDADPQEPAESLSRWQRFKAWISDLWASLCASFKSVITCTRWRSKNIADEDKTESALENQPSEEVKEVDLNDKAKSHPAPQPSENQLSGAMDNSVNVDLNEAQSARARVSKGHSAD